MVPDRSGHEAPTRRDVVTYGGAVAAGGALAGCSDFVAGDSESGNGDSPDDGGSYTVEMAPAGEVAFDSVPQTWASYFPGYADMGVALGMADGLSAVGVKSRYYTSYYDELDGVSVDKSEITEIYNEGIDKELYYELDNDVHLTDPEWLVNNSFFGIDEADVEELVENVAPFVGNTIFRRTDGWHDYRYYRMYEAFEKVAQIFRREDRFEAFQQLHGDVIADVQTALPSADARPNGLLCFAAADEPEEFSPYRLTDKGTNKKHFRDLGIGDALAGTGVDGLSTTERGKIDYETMLEVDPDTLFVRGHETKSRSEFEDTVLAYMQEHSVASELTAVQDGAVYRGGPIYQGPIQNLFLTERFATLLFPDAFDEELFDRQRVADIVAGDV